MFDAQMLLTQFLTRDDRAVEAAVLGEALARNNPKTSKASAAAVLAIYAYNTAIGRLRQAGGGGDDEAVDLQRLKNLATFAIATWPNDGPTDAARHVLGFYLLNKRQAVRGRVEDVRGHRQRVLGRGPGPAGDGRGHVLPDPTGGEGPEEVPRGVAAEHHPGPRSSPRPWPPWTPCPPRPRQPPAPPSSRGPGPRPCRPSSTTWAATTTRSTPPSSSDGFRSTRSPAGDKHRAPSTRRKGRPGLHDPGPEVQRPPGPSGRLYPCQGVRQSRRFTRRRVGGTEEGTGGAGDGRITRPRPARSVPSGTS